MKYCSHYALSASPPISRPSLASIPVHCVQAKVRGMPGIVQWPCGQASRAGSLSVPLCFSHREASGHHGTLLVSVSHGDNDSSHPWGC